MKISNEITDVELLKELGARLRHERIVRRIKQQEMAERCGLARTSLIKLENGDGGVRLATLVSVMRQLGILNLLEVAVPAIEISPSEQFEMDRLKKSLPERVRDTKPKARGVLRWGNGKEVR